MQKLCALTHWGGHNGCQEKVHCQSRGEEDQSQGEEEEVVSSGPLKFGTPPKLSFGGVLIRVVARRRRLIANTRRPGARRLIMAL